MTNLPLHPLAPLAGDEITRARQIVADSGRTSIPAADVRYAYVGLCEPPKDLRTGLRPGRGRDGRPAGPPPAAAGPRGQRDRGDRLGHPGRGGPLARGGRRPPGTADGRRHGHPGGAARARGLERRAGPAGDRGHLAGPDRPVAGRHLRGGPRGGSADLPLSGLPARLDRRQRLRPSPRRPHGLSWTGDGARCSRWSTSAWCPSRPKAGATTPSTTDRCAPTCARSTITQPEGPSFTVEGNLVRWQKWSMRVGMDPHEGLVLHTIGYEDGGGVRPLIYRASVSEMVVPYGHPGPMHAWKNAFDVGEWGLGRMANSLTLGCDCLGEIHYFDDVFADEHGKPRTSGQRHLHARGGLRHPLEARRPAVGANRGAPLPATGHQLHRHRRATTSTASTGTSIWTGRCSWKSS